MIRSGSASWIAAVGFILCLAGPAPAQKTAKPKTIEVIANDYAFLSFPTSISAGPTIFTFVNQGKVPHEVAIARLKSGVTVEEFTKAEAPRRRDLVERSVGILIGGPNIRPDGSILVNLLKGSTYVAFCNFRDTPESPTHMTLGMYQSFTPK